MSEQRRHSGGNALWHHHHIYLLTWSRFEETVRALFESIVQSGYVPNAIVSIAKGGLVPGVKLAHLFDVPEFGVIYIKRNVTSAYFPERDSPKLYWSGIPRIENSRILIVDDIVGSGDTMGLARSVTQGLGPRSIKTASLVVNANSGQYPDFCALEVDDWIVFPWEAPVDFTRSAFTQNLPIVEV